MSVTDIIDLLRDLGITRSWGQVLAWTRQWRRPITPNDVRAWIHGEQPPGARRPIAAEPPAPAPAAAPRPPAPAKPRRTGGPGRGPCPPVQRVPLPPHPCPVLLDPEQATAWLARLGTHVRVAAGTRWTRAQLQARFGAGA